MTRTWSFLSQGQLPAEWQNDAARPVRLWGSLPPRPRVAIVGSRKASDFSCEQAKALAFGLARYGVTVVSGGAEGIDTKAHEGALDAGTPGLVVAPAWLESAVPASSKDTFGRIIAQGGGYVTDAPRAGEPSRDRYFSRNELMVALSDMVVLGETRFRGGGLNTMAFARKYQRARFVLPCPFGSQSLGSQCEAERRAAPLLWQIDPIMDLLTARAWDSPDFWKGAQRFARLRERRGQHRQRSDRRQASSNDEPDGSRRSAAHCSPRAGSGPGARAAAANAAAANAPEERAILEALVSGCHTPEQLCQRTGLAPAELQHRLLLLTLQGLVCEDAQGLLQVNE